MDAAALPPALRALVAHRYAHAANPARLYVLGLAEGKSQETGRESLRMLARLGSAGSIGWLAFPWHRLRAAEVGELRGLLAGHYPAASSANLRLASLRGVLRWAWLLELVDREQYERAREAAHRIKGYPQPRGREVARDELAALFDVCEADPDRIRGARDLALLRVLHATGMRRAEVASLRFADLAPGGVVRTADESREWRLTVLGKGRRARVFYLTGPALIAVERWLALRGRKVGPLFTPLRDVGHRRARPLSGQAVRAMMHRRAAEVGQPPANPHDVRRTVAGEILEHMGEVAAGDYLGHERIDTTRRYNRRQARASRAAARHMAGTV